ncbi:MAG: ribose 5-phosphate isomerase B [Acetivibrionales bacterium]|jgi:ribose 5-phosphate isomerase B
MAEKKIWIGNDHGGVQLKNQIIEYFSKKGYEFNNVGSDEEGIVRYPHYVEKVVSAIIDKTADRGILICSTGIGMSIAANKFKGIRAALCTSTYMAKMTRLHNDSNVLCLGGQLTGRLEALDIVETWLTTGFEGGRHCISLGLISEIEEKLLK